MWLNNLIIHLPMCNYCTEDCDESCSVEVVTLTGHIIRDMILVWWKCSDYDLISTNIPI